MNKEFQDKVIMITGGTSGIGEACVVRFAEAGAKIAISGRNEAKIEELSSQMKRRNTQNLTFTGDLTKKDFREVLVNTTIKEFGRIDVLVNAAGIIKGGTIEDTDPEDFTDMMDINLNAVFHLTQLCVPSLVETQGNVVNVSSVAGLRSFPGIMAYCVSKAGVDQLTRCAALELAPKGVRVNAVNPGVVKTNLHLREVMNPESYQKFLEHSRETHPLGRYGNPEEIADLILFLASEKAKWITGITCSIDGGRHLTCAR